MNARLKKFLHEEWLQLLLLLVPILSALAAMPFAADQVPMQWGAQGQVNWTAPKAWGLLMIPLSLVFTFGMMMLFERFDPKRRAEDGGLTAHGKATRKIRYVFSTLLAAVTFIQIAAALGRHPDVVRLVTTGLALTFACLGNLFGKLKPNRYAGFRVSWTMNSENVWRKTHRAAAWIWTSSGLLVAAICALAPTTWAVVVLLVWVVLIIVAPLIVAWKAHQEECSAAVVTTPRK